MDTYQEIYRVKLKYNDITTILDDLPSGMEKFDLNFVRSDKYHTVFNSYSLPIGFILGGKKIVDDIYDEVGITAYVEIFIELRNNKSMAFEPYVSGVLDFKQRNWLRDSTDIPIIDARKKARFIERDEIEYDLKSLVSTDNIDVRPFTNGFKDIIYNEFAPTRWAFLDINNPFIHNNLPIGLSDPYYYSHDGEIDVNYINSEIDPSPSWAFKGIPEDVYINLTDENKFVNFRFDLDVELSGRISGVGSGGVAATMVWNWFVNSYTSSGTLISENSVLDYSATNTSINTDLTFTHQGSAFAYVDLTVPPNGSVKVFGKEEGFGEFVEGELDTTTNIYNYEIREKAIAMPETTAKNILIYEAFTRLIQLSTSELSITNILYSEILGRTDSQFNAYTEDGEYSLLALTNGFNLRGLDKPINLSISDAFESLDSILCLGLWFDNDNDRFEIKKREDYYKDNQIIDLGEVESLEIKPIIKNYINDIEGGYDSENSYDEVNGLIEQNKATSNSTSIENKSSLDIQSKINADTLGIVQSLKYALNPPDNSNDLDSDKVIFVTQTKRNGLNLETETGYDFNNVTGIIDGEQFYNYRLTPKRNLLRHGAFISQVYWKTTDKYINTVSTRNDLDLTTQLNSTDTVISELDNEIVNPSDGLSNVADPLYDNEMYTLTAPISSAMVQQLMTDPHGYIRFTYLDKEYKGFVDSVSTNIFERKGNITLIKKHEPIVNDNSNESGN